MTKIVEFRISFVADSSTIAHASKFCDHDCSSIDFEMDATNVAEPPYNVNQLDSYRMSEV